MTASLATSSSEIWREESVPGHPCMATMGTELALPMGPVWWQLGPTRGLPGWENLASACWGGTSNRRDWKNGVINDDEVNEFLKISEIS